MTAHVETMHEAEGAHGARLAANLAAVGWGLFFLWVGLAMLTGVSTAVGLLGVGVITLGMQAVRLYLGLPLEGFWAVVGALFALGGLGAVLELNIPVVPIVLVGAGLLLLLSVVRH